SGAVACEPRHPSWFEPAAEALLGRSRIARVAADPAPVPAALPGGWDELRYHRLHGSPEMYYSRYGEEFLARLAVELTRNPGATAETWCIFDNTAAGFAMPNALTLFETVTARLPSDDELDDTPSRPGP